MAALSQKMRWQDLLASFLILVSFLTVVIGLIGDSDSLGHRWRQADWLINYGGGFVRRGISGELFLLVSDALGVSPVDAVIFVVCALLGVITVCLLSLIWRIKLSGFEYFLVASPLGYQFWAIEFEGSGRKELLALCSIFMVAAAAGLNRRARVGISIAASLLFVLAVAMHEGNAFALAAMVAVLFVVLRTELRLWMALGGFMLAASAAVYLVYLPHTNVDDAADICARLAATATSGDFCDGAIATVGKQRGLPDLLKWTGSFVLSPLGVGAPLSLLLLVGLPLVAQHKVAPPTGFPYIVCGVLLVTFAPLYLFALDWGRWMNFSYMGALAFVLALRVTGGWAPPKRETSWLNALFVVVTILVGINHRTGEPLIRPCLVVTGVETCLPMQPLRPLFGLEGFRLVWP